MRSIKGVLYRAVTLQDDAQNIYPEFFPRYGNFGLNKVNIQVYKADKAGTDPGNDE